MKSYSSTFTTTLNSEVNALVTCWQITFADETVVGLTDGDRPITIEGVTYSPVGGFKPSDVNRDLAMSANQVTLQSYFSDSITENDLISGRFSDAGVFVFRVDPYHPPSSLSATPLEYDPGIRGRIGKITVTDQTFQIEVKGLADRLSTKQGWVTSANCRNRFCDARCGLDIADYTDSITVTGPDGNQFFTSNLSFSDNFYTEGRLTWLTGDNTGRSSTVIYSNGSNIRLFDPMPYPIQVGDTASIQRGCDKTFRTCRSIFGNGLNFNGEPGLPGTDAVAGAI